MMPAAWLNILLLAVVLPVVIYLLYTQGFAFSKSIAAIIFMFWPGNTSDQATLDSCTGWVRHVGRFRENRIYEFMLTAQLTKGDVEVSILNREKQLLLKLTRWYPAGQIALDGTSRYYLHWEFKNASGKCSLHW